MNAVTRSSGYADDHSISDPKRHFSPQCMSVVNEGQAAHWQ
jgi:hypothetical protein